MQTQIQIQLKIPEKYKKEIQIHFSYIHAASFCHPSLLAMEARGRIQSGKRGAMSFYLAETKCALFCQGLVLNFYFYDLAKKDVPDFFCKIFSLEI